MARKKSKPVPVASGGNGNGAGKKSVPIVVKLPGAREVVLTGDFTGWAKDKIRLFPAGPGEWGGQVELPPGEYQYRLIVDGEWRDDPNGSKKVPNPFGTHNSVLIVA